MAKITGLVLGDFVHTFGDVHLYHNHFDQAKLQLSREPRPLPTLKINANPSSIDGFNFDDFELQRYDPFPAIKAAIAV